MPKIGITKGHALLLALLACACTGARPEPLASTPPQRKDLEGCEGLGASTVCHACLHAVAGPYGNGGAPVAAQPTSATFIFQSADLVHNLYTITLPETEPGSGEHAGVLVYFPVAETRRPHALWLSRELEVEAFAHDFASAMTRPIDVVFEQRFTETSSADCQAIGYGSLVSNCHTQFPYVVAFDMIGDGSEEYYVYFSGADAASFRTVFEDLSSLAVGFFRDADDDGAGDTEDAVYTACGTPPPGFVAEGDDCAPTDPAIHPGAVERCDGHDDDCDETVDEACVVAPVDAGASDGAVPEDAGAEDAGADAASIPDAGGAPDAADAPDASDAGDAGSSAGSGGGCRASPGARDASGSPVLALLVALLLGRRVRALSRAGSARAPRACPAPRSPARGGARPSA